MNYVAANDRLVYRGKPIVTAGKAPKRYVGDRECVECGGPISRYNRHKTCWVHTPVEKYVRRAPRQSVV